MGRVIQLKLPDIGEGIAEGEIVEWLIKEGDFVKQFQPVVKVMTAKATVEIPSPVSGIVRKLLAQPGDVVQVGQPIMEIEVEGAEAGKRPEEKPKPDVEEQVSPKRAPVQGKVEAELEERKTPVLIRAPPRVRRLARQLGVDLSKVRGTGPRGVITEEDVRRAAAELREMAAAAATPALSKTTSKEAREERIPLRGVKRIMAQTMSESKKKIPHAYIIEEVDFTELVKLRDSLKPLAKERGVKLTYLPFIVKAVVKALKMFPLLNASFDEDKMEVVVKKYYNIGIAVDTDYGLVVPVIKDADKKGLFALAREITELAEKARKQQLSIDSVTGATFTVTNVGSIGSVMGLPVIYPPNVAILGVHRVVERPMYIGEEIRPRKIVYLSLSFDHRVIEGAYAARFLTELKRMLENPALIFASDDEFA